VLPEAVRRALPGVGVYDLPTVYTFELAINRSRRLFTAFATAAAIGGLVGSPAALAEPEPPAPPEPVPAPAPANIPELPGLIAPGLAPTHVSEIPRADG
jgi:hypothetical protein